MTRWLPRALVAAIDDSPILGVRAGAATDHRVIGIWAVVADGRVCARSWKQSAGGWYRTFLDDPLGVLEVGGRRVSIRAVRARGERIRDAIERAYAEKYRTPASLKFVRGFRRKRRRETIAESFKRRPFGFVHAGPDVQAFGRQRQIAIADAGRDVRAIGRLAARKSHVAVDARDLRARRVGAERGDEPFHRLPARLLDWSDHHILIAMSRRGEDLTGNLIVGDESFARWQALESAVKTRHDHPDLAEATIAGHPPGWSAGGERPKFGVLVDGRHVLIKFAARGGAGDVVARRWCDLLVLEALAPVFFAEGSGLHLAPAFDQVPMLYAPSALGQVPSRIFALPHATADTLDVWDDARMAAREFWQRASDHDRLSDDVRRFCAANAKALVN